MMPPSALQISEYLALPTAIGGDACRPARSPGRLRRRGRSTQTSPMWERSKRPAALRDGVVLGEFGAVLQRHLPAAEVGEGGAELLRARRAGRCSVVVAQSWLPFVGSNECRLSFRRLRGAGRSRSGCGRRRRRRCGPRAGSTCPAQGVHREGGLLARCTRGPSRCRRRRPRCAGRCAAGCPRRRSRRAATWSISARMAIMAVDEAVDLAQVLGLGRLHHQGAGDREGQGRGVEAVVDQALGHVLGGDAGLAGQLAQVQDALVRHQAACCRCTGPGSTRSGGRRCSSPRAGRSWWPRSGPRRPSARRRPRRSAARRPSRSAVADDRGCRRGIESVPAASPGRNGARWLGTRPGRRRVRRRRAGCRRSCAGSGARRRRRTCPAGPGRPGR